MPGIVEFPTVVQQAVQQFGDVFANEPERQHFGAYLTGLLVAEKKTVTGINAECAETTDQSCLNRWLGAAPWDVQQLNARRLAWHQHDPQTRDSERGIIPIDNTLVDNAGQLIEDAGYDGDHAEQRQKIAQDDLIAHYVWPSGQHDALEFRRFRKREDCAAKAAEWQAREGGLEAASEDDRRRATFKSHTLLCCELVDGVVERKLPGTLNFYS